MINTGGFPTLKVEESGTPGQAVLHGASLSTTEKYAIGWLNPWVQLAKAKIPLLHVVCLLQARTKQTSHLCCPNVFAG